LAGTLRGVGQAGPTSAAAGPAPPAGAAASSDANAAGDAHRGDGDSKAEEDDLVSTLVPGQEVWHGW
jgi:hypothetical protein